MTIKESIESVIKSVVSLGSVDLTAPPKPEMGDFAFACFSLAKKMNKNPVAIAADLTDKLSASLFDNEDNRGRKGDEVQLNLFERVEANGPYVNFFLNASVIAESVLREVNHKNFGRSSIGLGQKIMVEYAQPNTHKAFHIGHLRNIITGESLARIFENVGYRVIRVNYQGDVGLHIAKFLWGARQSLDDYKAVKTKTIEEKAEFLGRTYARGSQAYETDEKARQDIISINEKIYSKDKEIYGIYQETRKWSLEYFDKIYKRIGTKFDRLYFESETFEKGKKLVLENLKKGIFKQSEGAVIFEGEKFGLHNRVFLNQKGLPTYEAKDLALAEKQLKQCKPSAIYHIVGKEQTEYFKVLFKAIELVFPEYSGKEKHIAYGWVTLKEGKMSSRTGNVVLGEWLLDTVKEKIKEVVQDHNLRNQEDVAEKVAIAAVKYNFLRTGTTNDIVFSIKESVNLVGDSGPYLLYIIARIKSIRKKANIKIKKISVSDINFKLDGSEKKLIIDLSNLPEIAARSAIERDPSVIARYLLDLAQDFNNFYNLCPVLKSEGAVLNFRLSLIDAVEKVMTRGLDLLGVETVDEM